ncbi:MAG: YtxH domain-containing protein [Cyclobacteriaceae bacterium]|jgi:gas vesicle protein|nr:YtxH domain-containing protein [Cyclobacteriaceae bacterium]
MSKNSGDTLMAFIAGAAAGALLGILYAPDKGVHTRQKLSFQLEKYREMLQNLINDFVEGKETPLNSEAKSMGQKVVDDAKSKAEKLLEDVDELLDQIKGKNK